MKNNWTYYLTLQLKKMVQLLPKLLLGTIVLTLLVGTIAFYGTKLLYSKQSAQKVTIAIVLEDDSALMNLGMHYLESSDSVDTFCRLVKTSKNKAEQMLKNHTAAACIYFPEDFTKDIVSGKNTPATITFSEKTGIEQLLFQELTNTAAKILTSAQAGIYSLSDIYQNYRFQKKRSVHNDYINKNTLQTALVRSQLFEVESVSSTGSRSTKEYYIVSAIVLLLFLSGMTLSHVAKPESGSLALLLSRCGIKAQKRTFAKCLALSGFYLVVWCLLFLVGCIASLIPWNCFWFLPLLSLLASSWTLFFYSLTLQETTGTLLLFFSVFVCVFCSGALIPSAFLPQEMTAVAYVLPTYYVHKLILTLYTDFPNIWDYFPFLLFILFFFELSCFFARRAERRNA